jgi:pimeloyl-ACP methyl ester carboxylesterase
MDSSLAGDERGSINTEGSGAPMAAKFSKQRATGAMPASAKQLAAGLLLTWLWSVALAQDTSTLVDVDGHRLEVIAKGEGSPVVVFESGFAGGLTLWRPLQDRIAARTRTIAYERAGIGRSDTGPLPRTAKQIALELHELLERERVSGPIVLVGHSAGGMYVRVFAHEYPKQIAGLVLIDPATEGYYARLRDETPDDRRNAALRLPVGLRQQWDGLPLAMHEAAAAWPLPLVPVVIFTAKKPLGSWPLTSDKDMVAWLREHDALASRIPGAERVAIDSANHLSVLITAELGDRIVMLVDHIRAEGG